MKSLTHKPFAGLKLPAQVIRLPLPDRNDPDRYPGCDDEDGPPVEGATAVLIALPFGSVTRRSKRPQNPAAKLRALTKQRDVRECYVEDVRRGTNCKVLLP